MTNENAYNGEQLTLPELSLKIRVFELGSFHWKVDFRTQGTLALIRPTNFAAHGAPCARILDHFLGSIWLGSVLTEGSILINLESNFVNVNSVAEITVSWSRGGENTGLQRHWQGIFCESYQHNITDVEITFSTIASVITDFNICHQGHGLGKTLQYLFVISKTGFFAILGIRILIFQLVPVIGLFL